MSKVLVYKIAVSVSPESANPSRLLEVLIDAGCVSAEIVGSSIKLKPEIGGEK